MNSKESQKCPYNSIGIQLIDLKPTKNDSIYHVIIGQKDEVFRLIELFFKCITDDNDIDGKLLNQFSYQVASIVNFVDQNLNDNVEFIFSSLLAVFNKIEMVRNLKIAVDFYFRIRDNFKISTRIFTSDFIDFLLSQLKRNIDELAEKCREKPDNLDQMLEILGSFLEDLFYIVLSHVKDKSQATIWIDIMIGLLHLSRISYHRSVASSVKKILDNKYVSFKKHSNECATVIEIAFELAYENLEENINDEKMSQSISNLFYSLKSKIEKIEKHKLNAIQDQLYENVVFRPIEKPFKSKQICEIVSSWFDLIDPCEIKDEKRLKTDIKLAKMQLNIESRKEYYKNFFEFISNAIGMKKDLDGFLEEELIDLIEFSNDTDEFIDDDDRPNIKLLIIMKFTSAFSTNHELTDRIVEKLVESWFNVYSKHSDNDMVHSLFIGYCTSFSYYRPKSIASKAYLLWKYLFESRETSFLNILSSCLKESLDCFRNRFATDYFDFIAGNKSKEFHTSNLVLLNEISNVIPEFYLEPCEDKCLRVVKLLELAKETGNDFLASQLMGVVTNLASVLRKQSDIFEKYNQLVFEQRKSFRILIDFGKNDPRIRPAYFYALADFYSSLVVNKHSRIDYKRAEECVKELVELLGGKAILEDEDLIILTKIKDIGEFENRAYLDAIKSYKDYFLKIRSNAKNQPNVMNIVSSILDLDNNKRDDLVELLQLRTEENERTISELNENLAKKDLQIKTLEENLKSSENIIQSLKSGSNRKTQACYIL